MDALPFYISYIKKVNVDNENPTLKKTHSDSTVKGGGKWRGKPSACGCSVRDALPAECTCRGEKGAEGGAGGSRELASKELASPRWSSGYLMHLLFGTFYQSL